MIRLTKDTNKKKKIYILKERENLFKKFGVCRKCGEDITSGPNGEVNNSKLLCYAHYIELHTENKLNYNIKKINGICIHCNEDAEPNSSLCKKHKERISKRKPKKKDDKCPCGRQKFKRNGVLASICSRCIIRMYEHRVIFNFLKTGKVPGRRGRKPNPQSKKKFLIVKIEPCYRPAVRKTYMSSHLDVKRSSGRKKSGVLLNYYKNEEFEQDESAEKIIIDIRKRIDRGEFKLTLDKIRREMEKENG